MPFVARCTDFHATDGRARILCARLLTNVRIRSDGALTTPRSSYIYIYIYVFYILYLGRIYMFAYDSFTANVLRSRVRFDIFCMHSYYAIRMWGAKYGRMYRSILGGVCSHVGSDSHQFNIESGWDRSERETLGLFVCCRVAVVCIPHGLTCITIMMKS